MSSSDPWTLRPASSKALKQWQQAAAEEPDLLRGARERLRSRPLDRRDNPRRLGPLKGGLKVRRIGGKRLPQWQYEITSAGRIWFCPDKEERIIWITFVSLSHPKATD